MGARTELGKTGALVLDADVFLCFVVEQLGISWWVWQCEWWREWFHVEGLLWQLKAVSGAVLKRRSAGWMVMGCRYMMRKLHGRAIMASDAHVRSRSKKQGIFRISGCTFHCIFTPLNSSCSPGSSRVGVLYSFHVRNQSHTPIVRRFNTLRVYERDGVQVDEHCCLCGIEAGQTVQACIQQGARWFPFLPPKRVTQCKAPGSCGDLVRYARSPPCTVWDPRLCSWILGAQGGKKREYSPILGAK